MISSESNFEVMNRRGDVIYATVTWPPSAEGAHLPLVFLLHGFKGFRNWGFFPIAAKHLADAGMLVVRLDFSQNGMRGTADRVMSTSDFAANTITRELEDVADLLNNLRTSDSELVALIRSRWNNVLQIVGHSRGGGIAQLAGVEHEARKVVVWNSVGDWERWTPRQRSAWVESGIVEVENTRTGQMLQMNSTYLLDIEANRERLSLVAACRHLSDRLLFVHAEQDLTVPLREVQSLLRDADVPASLTVVSNTTHTFGMTHPTDRVTPAFVEALAYTTTFLLDSSDAQT